MLGRALHPDPDSQVQEQSPRRLQVSDCIPGRFALPLALQLPLSLAEVSSLTAGRSLEPADVKAAALKRHKRFFCFCLFGALGGKGAKEEELIAAGAAAGAAMTTAKGFDGSTPASAAIPSLSKKDVGALNHEVAHVERRRQEKISCGYTI
ncbi:unnamed protein product [Polarella glacialis]|uniref:Uncharacterized protein n=1 Tax=Polarella glacialis TaxID=89957 RepID=A0A813G859_POLGL|nr:unnamed protein product [Polarella glacialis]